jgi:wobble nucleotide-excising tRNase
LTGKTDSRANESFSDFEFLILEQPVPITARQDDAPSFKNTLSEGDKSTLAFAFFIATLEHHVALADQIVVFDDPLSSLDRPRREATVALLKELGPKVRQVAVFTHNLEFLRMLYGRMPGGAALQLLSDKANGSRITAFDVEEDKKGEYASQIERMMQYLLEDKGVPCSTIQGDLRKVIETNLKTKYYRTLKQDIHEGSGLGALLKKLFGLGLLDGSLKGDLFDLCGLTNGVHHGEIVDKPLADELTRDELLPLIERTFTLIERL